MRVAIIDDEPPARRHLGELLREFADVEIIGEAGGVRKGCAICLSHQPDVLFLDIEMGQGNGFELLNLLPEPRPAVIFVTAHERFALSAFDVAAIDYLLKPIAPIRLTRAIERVRTMLPHRSGKISVPLDSGMITLDAREIACVRADQNYTRVYTRSAKSYYVRRGIQVWGEMLEGKRFARLHRSLIVNPDAIIRLRSASRDTGELLLEGMDEELPLARRALQRLRSLLG